MGRMNLRGRWIVVTGASSGLGRALAMRLAVEEGANLWLCARREDHLKSLQAEIRARTPVNAMTLRIDLSRSEDREMLIERTAEKETVFGLINNAGITHYGATELADLDTCMRIIEINQISVMDLSLRFLDQFRKRGSGFILNVTSEAAFVPTPYQAAYSMSKHGIQAFTDALRIENSEKEVFIGTFVPGGIRTEMITGSGLDQRIRRDSWVNQTPERAARCCISGLKKRRPITIPGVINKSTHFLAKVLPRNWVLTAAGMLYRPPGKKGK